MKGGVDFGLALPVDTVPVRIEIRVEELLARVESLEARVLQLESRKRYQAELMRKRRAEGKA